MFEIIDDNGTIHSGGQNEMECAFHIMTTKDESEYSPEEIKKWEFDWSGDLKLIEVHQVTR
jgi:hypothetical protein